MIPDAPVIPMIIRFFHNLTFKDSKKKKSIHSIILDSVS